MYLLFWHKSHANSASMETSSDQTERLLSHLEGHWGALSGQESPFIVWNGWGWAPVLRNVVGSDSQSFLTPRDRFHHFQSFVISGRNFPQVYSIRLGRINSEECYKLIRTRNDFLSLRFRLQFFFKITVKRIRLDHLSNTPFFRFWWKLFRVLTIHTLLLFRNRRRHIKLSLNIHWFVWSKGKLLLRNIKIDVKLLEFRGLQVDLRNSFAIMSTKINWLILAIYQKIMVDFSLWSRTFSLTFWRSRFPLWGWTGSLFFRRSRLLFFLLKTCLWT